MTFQEWKRLNPHLTGDRGQLRFQWKIMEKMQSMYTETVSVMNIGAGVVTAPGFYGLSALAPNKTATEVAYQQACVPVEANSPIKKGKKMAYYEDDCDCCSPTPLSDETKKRRYLSDRVEGICRTKRQDLRAQFNMDEVYPNTVQELIDRVKAGTFTVKQENLNRPVGWVGNIAVSFIDWRDPSKPADETGFNKGYAALEAAETAAYDQVQVGDLTDALKAVQAFENWTYTA